MSSLGEQMSLAASVISEMAQQSADFVDEGETPWSRHLEESVSDRAAHIVSDRAAHIVADLVHRRLKFWLAELAFLAALTAASELSRLILRCRHPNTQVLQAHNRVCSLVLGWHSTSSAGHIFTQWVSTEWWQPSWELRGGWHSPLFYTMNMGITFTSGILALFFHILTRREMPEVDPNLIPKVLRGTVLVGVCGGLGTALSSLSSQYLTPSFSTTLVVALLQGCHVLFILAFGIILKLEALRVPMFGVLAVIVTGLLLIRYQYVVNEFYYPGFHTHYSNNTPAGLHESTVFHTIWKREPLRLLLCGVAAAAVTWLRLTVGGFGVTLVICSQIFAALRLVLPQLLLQWANFSTATIVLLAAPCSTLSLLPFALAMEWSELRMLLEPGVLGNYLKVIVVNGALAFLWSLFEVELVKSTSSLTTSVLWRLSHMVGLALTLAIPVFGEESSLIQWIGIAVALAGISGYGFLKHLAKEADTSEQTEPLLGGEVS